jgi:hypothetical protein
MPSEYARFGDISGRVRVVFGSAENFPTTIVSVLCAVLRGSLARLASRIDLALWKCVLALRSDCRAEPTRRSGSDSGSLPRSKSPPTPSRMSPQTVGIVVSASVRCESATSMSPSRTSRIARSAESSISSRWRIARFSAGRCGVGVGADSAAGGTEGNCSPGREEE